ncbi:MAG: TIM barrel protein [Candidatus Limnocylindrales bacterium]
MSIRGIGTAPVSFGVYGIESASGITPLALLDAAAAAGYSAMELGPAGFFGTPEETMAAFAARGLVPVAAYAAIRFTADDETVAADLDRLRHTLAELASAPDGAVVILADEGTTELAHHPARDAHDRGLALDEAGWKRIIGVTHQAVEMADVAGVRASFHPHIATYVESPAEVERLLAATTVGLTLDTGHFWLAGADPTDSLARFGDRVDHVHLKDVDRSVLLRAKAQRREDFEAWWADVSTPLGSGDIDLAGFLERLGRIGYDGWLVIEQDRQPLAGDPVEPVIALQARNRVWVEKALERLGLPPSAEYTG